jgi:hypothetical protein
VGEDPRTPELSRYTVTQAADMLGISSGAVRNRLSRGSLAKVKEGGTVYVLLPADMSRHTEQDTTDTASSMSHGERDTLTSELRDRLRYVEGQLEAERQAHAEARRLLMAALERIPPQLEAPPDERQSPETAEEEPERAETHPDAPSPQEGVQRRSWWRRMFGTLTK